MKLDFPVMLFMLLAAAFLQNLLPSFHGGMLALKLPVLPAVALYYVLDRQRPLALFAAVWAGILMDALGGVPPGTSSFGLLFVTLVIFAIRRYFPESSWILPGIIGTAQTAFLLILQYCILRSRTDFTAPFYLLFRPFLTVLPVSAVISVVIVAAARKLELMAGNVKPRKEVQES